jgi:hypothetical protein
MRVLAALALAGCLGCATSTPAPPEATAPLSPQVLDAGVGPGTVRAS